MLHKLKLQHQLLDSKIRELQSIITIQKNTIRLYECQTRLYYHQREKIMADAANAKRKADTAAASLKHLQTKYKRLTELLLFDGERST